MKLDWLSWQVVALVAIVCGSFSFLAYTGKLPPRAIEVVIDAVGFGLTYLLGRVQKQPEWAKPKPESAK
jgi:hypothetical protein